MTVEKSANLPTIAVDGGFRMAIPMMEGLVALNPGLENEPKFHETSLTECLVYRANIGMSPLPVNITSNIFTLIWT